MSISTVKAGLDDIAEAIRVESQAIINSNQRILDAKSNLETLPAVHADTINEVNGYVGADPFEALSKDELAKLTTEFLALIGTL